MACAEPKAAWLYYRGGRPQFVAPPAQSAGLFKFIDVSCGKCTGCRVRQARDWAIRCLLENDEHDVSSFVTLTYDPKFLPRAGDQPTLDKQHLSGYLKRLRSRVEPLRFKFFGAGEYGDLTGRPHYHLLLFGLSPRERHIAAAWQFGHVSAEPVTPARVAYTAGYVQKKMHAAPIRGSPRVDPETGEVLDPEPPFRHVSRGGKSGSGLGGSARRHVSSWRANAIWRGSEVPVPRYLHNAWKAVASASEMEELELERAVLPRRSWEQREAGEKIALRKLALASLRRQKR